MPTVTLPLRFNQAIKNKNVDAGWCLAQRFPNGLPLDQALELTILLGELGDRRLDPAARRFLVRFIEELKPTLDQVKRVADALHNLVMTTDLPALQEEAVRALEDLAGQLRRG